ncbi:trem-like transcript 4 protein isoform X4 [Marmota marmota marmota]|uniref:trem-like transcript 4 protein isoform X4 n=1 Tax=Marmota marmota marmota TaxID=9994 RepID=UPI002092CEC2|nr:trem-like transcript 4 protein isoform X4 [Marmota marmota marmota]
MAWEGLRLLMHPVALVLLVPGSWGLAVTPEELREVVGGTLLVQCWSSPQEGPYMQKTWCRQRSPGRCTRLVTTSQPLTAVENAQHTIWDHPKAGFFIVTMTQLREEDLGVYLCGSFNSSQNLINTFRNITLVVSPALITSPEGTSSPSVNGSEQGERRPKNSPPAEEFPRPRCTVGREEWREGGRSLTLGKLQK